MSEIIAANARAFTLLGIAVPQPGDRCSIKI
jgi:hypothetical protein